MMVLQRGRITLCFFFLLGMTLRPAAVKKSIDVIQTVNKLISNVSNTTLFNASLYTPTLTDFQQRCPNSTIRCFAAEVQVLFQEWNIRRFNRLRIQLQNIASSYNTFEPPCPCELSPEKNVQQFLSDLLVVLQAMMDSSSSH